MVNDIKSIVGTFYRNAIRVKCIVVCPCFVNSLKGFQCLRQSFKKKYSPQMNKNERQPETVSVCFFRLDAKNIKILFPSMCEVIPTFTVFLGVGHSKEWSLPSRN